MAENLKPYRIALVQMAMGADLEANRARAAELTEQAAGGGAKIICLPELFSSRYFCQREEARLFDLAEPIPGPSTERFGAIARQAGVTILASLFERRAPGVYHNTLVTIGPDGQVAGLYRKMHIPDDPHYYEKFYFTPGDTGFRAVDTSQGRIGGLVCWDQWFPEAARLTALRGATVLFYPTAIGWLPEDKIPFGASQRDAWQTVQRSHAIANGVYVVAVNRIGFEPTDGGAEGEGIEFWGTSFVADPMGVVIAQASTDREEILYAEIDPARIEAVRRGWPFLRDRRIDAYEGLGQRFLDGR